MSAPEASTVSSFESFVKESNSQQGKLNKDMFFFPQSHKVFCHVNYLANKKTSARKKKTTQSPKTVVEETMSSLDTEENQRLGSVKVR